MRILSGCRVLLSAVIREDVARHGRLEVVKYAGLTPRARYATTFSHQRLMAIKRAQQHHPQPACQDVPKRQCSEMLSELKSGDELVKAKVEDTCLTGNTSFNIDAMVSLLRQENAVDICVIKIPEELNYSDYFIVVTGISPRHLSAMAYYAIKVHKYMKKESDPHAKLEGRDTENWKCIDFGRMVLHLMLPETRELYELEKLWCLRSFDEQLRSFAAEIPSEDFIYRLSDIK